MTIADFVYKLRGVNPSVKKKYQVLFNSQDNYDRGTAVLDDLMMRFKFYGAAPTTDPIQLAINAAHREVIEYILTMASRISDDTLQDIQNFINR